MKDWMNLQPDEYRLMNKHYTTGRTQKIRGVVLHHNAGRMSIEDCWNAWQTRKASAHYQVDASGRIGQLVHDLDTAWHAGSANSWTIGIEHANDDTGNWTIGQTTLESGAHLVAAICRYYELGRPQWLVNVFPHSHFMSTACPGQIAGSQNAEYMARAQYWYDRMTGTAALPSGGQGTQSSAGMPLAVDGSCGPATVRRWQEVMGTSVDGVISGQVVPDQRTYRRPNLDTSAVSYGGYGSELIRAVQRSLGGLDADGLLGPATIRAVQAHYGLAQDASFGPDTVKALQTALNEGRF